MSITSKFNLVTNGDLRDQLDKVNLTISDFDFISRIAKKIGLNQIIKEGYRLEQTERARQRNSHIQRFYEKSSLMDMPLFGDVNGVDIATIDQRFEQLRQEVFAGSPTI
eukprot:Gregarina_sp_Poly_1__6@NODE_1001_length_5410_cov_144_854950_g702_i0_p7_GENE_NODE_1001_length_5410_cov_144_854950_g702_i0NODE_1001_length_5410_cov_144_854950_g702_i0_p7_ORF_typecomplete_len109_score13_80Dynamitin/PF04912_14/0_055_NODE_1001_length_5410_cov_144_854950_g702_i07731099